MTSFPSEEARQRFERFLARAKQEKNRKGNRMGVKKITSSFALLPELHDRAKQHAAVENMSYSELIRRAVQEYLDRHDQQS